MVALLERADEWDALTAAVGAAGRSRGSVVLVSGEAGIGKTSLVRAFAEHVAGRTRRFVGGCDDLLTARPLGPLRDAAAGSGGPLEAALRSGGDVFAAVVAELSGPRVTAVVVEDLHWADDATLDVLGYLARRIADLPAVLVLTYRDEAAATAHPVHRLLGSLVGRRVVRLPLRALSSAAVVGLAAGSGWDPQRLHALTGGNPFYVTEALAQTGPGVPVSVSDAVLARVARLDDTARAAVEQLSVVPTIVGLDLAHSLLGDRLDALAEAEARGIVSSGAGGLTFRHELARQAVEQSLTPLRRRTLHRAVVAALQAERAPDLARLVHHAAAADDGATVSRYAPLAGREAAAAGSHRQALAHFSAALRHGHRLVDADLARLVDEHAWELYNAGRFTEALRGGERAVRLRRRGCPGDTTAGSPGAATGPVDDGSRPPDSAIGSAPGPIDDGSRTPDGAIGGATGRAIGGSPGAATGPTDNDDVPSGSATVSATVSAAGSATGGATDDGGRGPSPRRWCGCRGTGSWRATPTAPTPRPRRPSPCSTHRSTPRPALDPIPRARRRTGRSPRRTSARSARSPATPVPTIGTTIGPPTRSCAAPGSWRRRRAAPTSWRSAATTRASPAPTSTTTPGSRCSPAACAPDWSRASTRSRRAPTRTSASCASA